MGTRPEGTEDPRDRGTTSHERGMDTGDLLVAWLTTTSPGPRDLGRRPGTLVVDLGGAQRGLDGHSTT